MTPLSFLREDRRTIPETFHGGDGQAAPDGVNGSSTELGMAPDLNPKPALSCVLPDDEAGER